MWVNPILALITFAYTPIGMWATTSINQKMNALYPQNADYKGEALSVVEQALMQIPIIKSYMIEKRIRQKISQSYDKVKNIEKKISLWYSLMQPACSSTANVPKIMFLIFAGYMVMQGNFTLGAFIAIYDLLNLIIGPTVYFPFMLNSLNKSIASINRIRRLEDLDIAKAPEYKPVDNIPTINIDNITFSYEEGKNIIENFSFKHKGSGIIAFCGGSGTGKTTLLDIIAGLYTPTSGNITVSGDVSFVTQESFIFNKTIRDNVHIAKPCATHDELQRAIMLSHAKEFIEEIGSDTLIGEGNVDLSGGQKQRLSLARAILADKKIVLMDEPTSALDKETEQVVIKSIKEMAKNKLVIMSVHRKSLINIADRKVMIGG
jgi:ABC-type bacteriocin/lantibiotic exporter with double-glycine peptidase domain